MPQDELWAASARLTGYQFTYYFAGPQNSEDLFSVRTFWSKNPDRTKKGDVVIGLDPSFRWHAITLMNRAGGELLGGYARNVPGVVKAELSRIREGFSTGLLQ